MQFIQNSIFTRRDTMFGVCQSLGEDLGISPNWLRVGFAAVVIYSIQAAIVTYAVLGLIVFASRMLFPNRKAAAPAAPVVDVQAPAAEPVHCPQFLAERCLARSE